MVKYLIIFLCVQIIIGCSSKKSKLRDCGSSKDFENVGYNHNVMGFFSSRPMAEGKYDGDLLPLFEDECCKGLVTKEECHQYWNEFKQEYTEYWNKHDKDKAKEDAAAAEKLKKDGY